MDLGKLRNSALAGETRGQRPSAAATPRCQGEPKDREEWSRDRLRWRYLASGKRYGGQREGEVGSLLSSSF